MSVNNSIESAPPATPTPAGGSNPVPAAGIAPPLVPPTPFQNEGRNVYVKHLPDDTTEERLREIFSPFGAIESVSLQRDDRGTFRGFAFVCYSHPYSAQLAVAYLHMQLVLGPKEAPLYVQLAQRKESREKMLEQQRRRFNEPLSGGVPPMYPYAPSPFPPMPGQLYPFPPPFLPGFPMPFPGHMVPPMMPPVTQPARPQPNSDTNAGTSANNASNYNASSNSSTNAGAPTLAPPAPLGYPPHNTFHNQHSYNYGQQPAYPYYPIFPQQRGWKRGYRGNNPNKHMHGPRPGAHQGEPPRAPEAQKPTEEADKTDLGEKLYQQINQINPEQAAKITGMLLEMDTNEILSVLEDHGLLRAKVDEAVGVLRAHEQQQQQQ